MEKVPGPVGGEEPESRHVPADRRELLFSPNWQTKLGPSRCREGKGEMEEVRCKARRRRGGRKGRDGKNTLTCHPIEGKVQGNIVDCTVQPSTLGGELTTGGQRPGEGTGWLSPTCKTRGANACTG
eukprot:GGOE01009662.1.p5 GENE.GGOE01009662.1~~GGOE01009662.1.p5  ORF type:complete len:126 (+),score=3.14 GGOE01009662.1:247-624(+)